MTGKDAFNLTPRANAAEAAGERAQDEPPTEAQRLRTHDMLPRRQPRYLIATADVLPMHVRSTPALKTSRTLGTARSRTRGADSFQRRAAAADMPPVRTPSGYDTLPASVSTVRSWFFGGALRTARRALAAALRALPTTSSGSARLVIRSQQDQLHDSD